METPALHGKPLPHINYPIYDAAHLVFPKHFGDRATTNGGDVVYATSAAAIHSMKKDSPLPRNVRIAPPRM